MCMDDKRKLVQELSAEIIKLTMNAPMPWFATIFALGLAAKAMAVDATNLGGGELGSNVEQVKEILIGAIDQEVIVDSAPDVRDRH